ncbi:MAG TPA: 6-hydroxymethylpterin diphosphokinase MptE-like protein [Humisphaera sp.]
MPVDLEPTPDAPAADDPSSRFVLPSDHPYLKNIEALWGTEPDLAKLIEAIPDADLYPVETTRAGVPTVALAGPAGRPVPLHSRYDPAAEAARLVASVDVGERLVLYVHGLGLGYHVEALFDRAGDEANLFVFEPDLRLVRTALFHRDLSRLIESRRVVLLTRPDKTELNARLTPHLAVFPMGTASLEHGPSVQLQPAFHAQAKQSLEEFASYARTTVNTFVLNSSRTAENIARNLGWYVASPSLSRLKDRFKGKPAVIVSAGPSLRKNKHLLPKVAGKAVVVAVQTTLQPLVQAGIDPHFVTSLDYHEISTRFFQNLPTDRKLKTELVAEPKATSAVFDLLGGNTSLLGNDFADALLREMKLEKTKLPAGATVAHLAFYLSEHLGCDPVIFLGQDLGFSDGLCYAPGTSYEDVWRPETGRFCSVEMKQWDQIVRERFILRRIPDHQGRAMYTEERLFSYLQQFERDFAKTGRTVVDATEGGAFKRGSKPMPFAEAIETYCTEPFDVDLGDHPGPRWERVPECVGSLERRREEAGRIAAISEETLPLLEEIRDHTEDQRRVNAAIAKLDGLRARMNELGPTYDLVTELTQKSQLDRHQADRRIRQAKLDPVERQRRQVDRDIANVRSVLEAARRFEELMTDVIGHLAAAPVR